MIEEVGPDLAAEESSLVDLICLLLILAYSELVTDSFAKLGSQLLHFCAQRLHDIGRSRLCSASVVYRLLRRGSLSLADEMVKHPIDEVVKE